MLIFLFFSSVIDIYGDALSTREAGGSQLSEKGVLQILLDMRFAADVLSGADSNMTDEFSDSQKPKYPFRRKQEQGQKKSVIRERVDGLVNRLSQRLDPINWLTIGDTVCFTCFCVAHVYSQRIINIHLEAVKKIFWLNGHG
uniref:Conserved oligomeric Golgi complex subunit 1 n=1 Tax=Quercus lobata TaxID=97700 RepID=A0A7N2KQP9_QUELO